MLPIEPRDFIVKFYDEVIKSRFPDLSLQQVSEICRAPFILIKKTIQSGKFTEIRVKYLGTFEPSAKRIYQQLLKNEHFKKIGLLNQEDYEYKRGILTKFLEKSKDALIEDGQPNYIEEYYKLHPRSS